MNNTDGVLQVEGEAVNERWREYFDILLNEENPFTANLPITTTVNDPQPGISIVEVKAAISKMKRGKAAGPDEITLEMVLALGEEGIVWLHRVMDAIWKEKRIPDDWQESILVSIFKNKVNIHECGNYRGIKFLSQIMKCFERILDSRMREIVEPHLGEEQFGFRKGKGTTDAMFIVRQMMERKLEFQQESSWGFLDLEKAYDKINREMIPPVLRQYHVPEELITMVMALYRTPRTQVRTCFGKTKTFEVKVGLHQGSALSPLLFIILLDDISKRCPMERGQKVIYADDIVLGANTAEELQQAVEMWYNQLAVHGMRMSKVKTEVLEVSRGQTVPRLQIMVDGQQLKQTAAFRYLRSWLQERGNLDREVQARLQGTRNTWRNING